ncbi:hypothetical protein B0H17DRAFT_1217518 [Mycena rosella]|uniref:Uncharacterized protein n=1 Tax=Mycena rosella TaxID=1033263 RepID=A0AAD7BXT7_MYCRO|nr:hypothetical protein B0H17DRAFT_1217518 [Mycena rosella]
MSGLGGFSRHSPRATLMYSENTNIFSSCCYKRHARGDATAWTSTRMVGPPPRVSSAFPCTASSASHGSTCEALPQRAPQDRLVRGRRREREEIRAQQELVPEDRCRKDSSSDFGSGDALMASSKATWSHTSSSAHHGGVEINADFNPKIRVLGAPVRRPLAQRYAHSLICPKMQQRYEGGTHEFSKDVAGDGAEPAVRILRQSVPFPSNPLRAGLPPPVPLPPDDRAALLQANGEGRFERAMTHSRCTSVLCQPRPILHQGESMQTQTPACRRLSSARGCAGHCAHAARGSPCAFSCKMVKHFIGKRPRMRTAHTAHDPALLRFSESILTLVPIPATKKPRCLAATAPPELACAGIDTHRSPHPSPLGLQCLSAPACTGALFRTAAATLSHRMPRAQGRPRIRGLSCACGLRPAGTTGQGAPPRVSAPVSVSVSARLARACRRRAQSMPAATPRVHSRRSFLDSGLENTPNIEYHGTNAATRWELCEEV